MSHAVTKISDNRCILTDTATGVQTEYWCPAGGGYVREIDEDHPGTLGTQVCDGLLNRGSTLVCKGRELVEVIEEEAKLAYDGYDRAEAMQLQADYEEVTE